VGIPCGEITNTMTDKRTTRRADTTCKSHYVDNQGLCHYCGLIMEPGWYEHYLHGTPTEKPDTKKPRARKKS